MAELPVMLRLHDRRALVVGGGAVARRRAVALLAAGARVTVVAPEVDAELARLPVTLHRRGYEPGDAEGCTVVVIATDDAAVNARAAADARTAGALVNRADDPEAGDFIVPAHRRVGPVTVAVHTGGVSPSAAAAIRDAMLDGLDADWPRLIELVEPFRARVRSAITRPDRRREALRAITGPGALRRLKEQGPDALIDFCERTIADAIDKDPA